MVVAFGEAVIAYRRSQAVAYASRDAFREEDMMILEKIEKRENFFWLDSSGNTGAGRL